MCHSVPLIRYNVKGEFKKIYVCGKIIHLTRKYYRYIIIAIKSYDEEKYCGDVLKESTGRWKPYSNSRTKNT